MAPKSIMITGCSRGIGLELVKQYLALANGPAFIFATYRKLTDELSSLAKANAGKLHLVKLDVTDYASYPKVVKQVEGVVGSQGLNCLINNAGVLPKEWDLNMITPEGMRQAFEINCVAPLFFTRAMLPLLKKAAELNKSAQGSKSVSRAAAIQMSTAVGSVAENTSGGIYSYRCSKSALNQAMKSLSIDLNSAGILVMSMHPGHVKTDMGGPTGQITAQECVSAMIKTLEGLSDKDHGTFLRYNNTPVAW